MTTRNKTPRKIEGSFKDSIGEANVRVEYVVFRGGPNWRNSFRSKAYMDSPPEPPEVCITVTLLKNSRDITHMLNQENLSRLEDKAFEDASSKLHPRERL